MGRRIPEGRVNKGVEEIKCTCGRWVPKTKAKDGLCYPCFRGRKREISRRWYRRQREKKGMQSRVLPDGLKDCIKEIYAAGYSCLEIEEMTGVNNVTVYMIIKKAGLNRSVQQARKISRRKGRQRFGIYSNKILEKNKIENLVSLFLEDTG